MPTTYDSCKFHQYVHDALNGAGIKCDLHIAKLATTKKPQYVRSMCIFKMRNSYKRYSMYFDRLRRIIQKNRQSNAIIRVYYDLSSAKEIATLPQDPHLELIEYCFHDFFQSPYHAGVFGTLMRFLGLFKVPHNHALNIITDCDSDIQPAMLTQALKQSTTHTIVAYTYTYSLANRFPCRTIGNGILAGFLLCRASVEFDIFIQFLRDVKGRAAHVTRWTAKNAAERHNRSEQSLFYYGIDEYFLNCFVCSEWRAAKHSLFLFKMVPVLHKQHYELIQRPLPIEKALRALLRKHGLLSDKQKRAQLDELLGILDKHYYGKYFAHIKRTNEIGFDQFAWDYYLLLCSLKLPSMKDYDCCAAPTQSLICS